MSPVAPVLFCIIFIALSNVVVAQDPDETATSFHDRVVDLAALKDGTKLWGSVAGEKPATLLVSTEWLKNQTADFYAAEIRPELQKEEQQSGNVLADLLQKDIEQLEGLNDKDPQRIGLLKEIIDRLKPEEGDSATYVRIEIPKSRLRRMDVQPPARRELCRLAFLNGIQDFEQLSTRAVTMRLQAIPQNMRRTAPPVESDDRMVHERILAAVDVQLGTATRLILSGNTVIDESAQSDPATLLSSMLGQNLESTLSQLLNEDLGQPAAAVSNDILPAPAIRMADAKQQSTIVLSGFDFDLTGGSAAVHRRLFHKSDDGRWKLVLSSNGAALVSELKPGQADALAKDPQVQQIAAAVEALGIGNEQLSTALQMGTVVQNALNQAEQSFQTAVLDTIAGKDAVRSLPVPTIRLAAEPPVAKER